MMAIPFGIAIFTQKTTMSTLSLTDIKGIGTKTAKLFNQLGVFDVEDLMNFYPVRFVPYEKMVSIEEIVPGEQVAICARIKSGPRTVRAGKLKITEAVIEDFSGKVKCVWFNSSYIVSGLDHDTEYVFAGKAEEKKNGTVIEHPIIYKADEYRIKAGKLRPLYRSVKGLSQKLIQKAIADAFSRCSFKEDYLPVDIKVKYGLMDYESACRYMHFAESNDEVASARKRLVFDEFLSFIYNVGKVKDEYRNRTTDYPIDPEGVLEEFTNELPYELTEDQKTVINEVFDDFRENKSVNRLIQGDVGSGKTIVSLIILYAAYKSGYQGVIMVPTEVLAGQHYKTCESVFRNFNDKPKIGLLTGSMTAREKSEMRRMIAEGKVDIVIGTHALIQDGVEFKNAAVVVTDEQHRFGVRQREKLSLQSKKPHILVMSATPIPRTLAVIIYGDMDISVILSKPQGRLPVKNAVISAKDRGKAYRTILDQINLGHQAYIICPLVEESEAVDAENVIDYTKKIKSIFPDNIVVQFLHGRMKQEEKDNIMCLFAEGNINILISTTVIEVGVDVPNATVMMIENADRFGLAALHQLRGRVGRGTDQSYCIFVRTGDSELSKKRLNVIGSSNDGFFIASEDLKLRGPGEILGQAQSGEMRFNIGDIYSDADVLALAKDCSDYIESEEFKPDDEIIRFRKHMEDYRDKTLTNLNL